MARKISAINRRPNVGAGQPEQELALLVQQRLGIGIDPLKLRQFICDKFIILSVLCHEIHAADESIKLTGGAVQP